MSCLESFLFFTLTLGYFILLIWGLVLSRNNDVIQLTNVLLLVIVGLIYDNLIIALGSFIGEGQMLESLSYGRYWLHALFTPTLIIFAWGICSRSHLSWARKTSSKYLAFTLTAGLILYELFTSIRGLELEPKWQNGILTYENISQSGTPVMIIFITLILSIVGIIFIIKFRFYWLFTGILVMALGSVLGAWLKFEPLMNILEFVLIVSLLLTKRFLVHNEKAAV